jgi:CubicO group peptidase (beta-lactamase class C family)
MSLLVTVFILLSFLFQTAFSQKSTTPNPVLTQQLDSIFRKNELVGMSVLVIKNNQIVYESYLGKADINRGIKVSQQTQYRVASLSKVVTAVAVMQLVEQGLLGLDDDINTHFDYSIRNPSFPNKPITIRALLSHTSTIADWAVWESFARLTFGTYPTPSFKILFDSINNKQYSREVFITKEPAKYFAYCNISYAILASLVEKMSKKRFDMYCREHIFKPLGMQASFNAYELPNINNLAVLYRKYGGKWIPQTDNYGGVKPVQKNYANYKLGTNALLFGPQGNLRASALDLYKLAMMLMNAGEFEKKQILKANTVKMMQETAWIYDGTNADGRELALQAWGLGLQITTDKEGIDRVFPNTKMYGHAGEAYGLISDMYFDTEKKNGLIFITNGSGIPFKTKYKAKFFEVEKAVFNAIYETLF